MEKRTILALVLSLAVLLGFQYLFPPAQPLKKGISVQTAAKTAYRPPLTEVSESSDTGSSRRQNPQVSAKASVSAKLVQKEKGERILVETSLYRAAFDTLGGCLKSFYLKKYKTENTPGSPELNLVTVTGDANCPLSGAIRVDGKWWADRNLAFTLPAAGRSLKIDDAHRKLVLTAKLPQGGLLVKEFYFEPATYVVGVKYKAFDAEGRKLTIEAMRLNWSHSNKGREKSRYVYNGIIGYINGKLFKPGKKDKKLARQELIGKIDWLGYTSKYFLSVLLIPEGKVPEATRGVINRNNTDNLTIVFQADGTCRMRAYIGPKSGKLLKSLNLHLEDSIEYGWFGIIARPLVSLLQFLYQYVHNYGVAIIILTILIKLVFFPLSQKSYKSMSQMKKIQPKLAKLKEKYKDDKARLNKEMMDLYRTHEVNPFGGCLPMLVQIPVFFALYRALMVAIELRHAPFVFWITDLSAKDPYYVTPLIMGATMFLQQKMAPSTGDAMQAKMMLFMPIIFTFMFLNFPSGLVLYWLVNNILSIGQQYLVMRQVEA